MSDNAEIGVFYPSAQAGPVDEWSERIYAALSGWPVSRDARWTRWEPGYLLLTIDRVNGAEVEPIQLHTADQELTVTFGYWETHNPAPYEFWDSEPEVIAEHAKALVQQWIDGEVRTAVFINASGKWCGSTMIEAGELAPQLKRFTQMLRDSHPVHIEVRTSARSGWDHYPVEAEWLRPDPLSPDRLPG